MSGREVGGSRGKGSSRSRSPSSSFATSETPRSYASVRAYWDIENQTIPAEPLDAFVFVKLMQEKLKSFGPLRHFGVYADVSRLTDRQKRAILQNGLELNSCRDDKVSSRKEICDRAIEYSILFHMIDELQQRRDVADTLIVLITSDNDFSGLVQRLANRGVDVLVVMKRMSREDSPLLLSGAYQLIFWEDIISAVSPPPPPAGDDGGGGSGGSGGAAHSQQPPTGGSSKKLSVAGGAAAGGSKPSLPSPEDRDRALSGAAALFARVPSSSEPSPMQSRGQDLRRRRIQIFLDPNWLEEADEEEEEEDPAALEDAGFEDDSTTDAISLASQIPVRRQVTLGKGQPKSLEELRVCLRPVIKSQAKMGVTAAAIGQEYCLQKSIDGSRPESLSATLKKLCPGQANNVSEFLASLPYVVVDKLGLEDTKQNRGKWLFEYKTEASGSPRPGNSPPRGTDGADGGAVSPADADAEAGDSPRFVKVDPVPLIGGRFGLGIDDEQVKAVAETVVNSILQGKRTFGMQTVKASSMLKHTSPNFKNAVAVVLREDARICEVPNPKGGKRQPIFRPR